MPFPLVPVAIGAAVVGGGALLYAKRKSDAAATCQAIEAQIASLVATGGDPNELTRLRVALNASGCPSSGSNACMDILAFMRAQFADYKRTSYSDPISRDNKRNAILTQARPLLDCLKAGLDAARTPAEVDAILATINQAIGESLDRANCMASEAEGCGRFGLNEEAGERRGWYEITALTAPLGVSLGALNPRFWNDPGSGRDAEAFAAAATNPGYAPFSDKVVVESRSRSGAVTHSEQYPPTAYGGLLKAAQTKRGSLSNAPQINIENALAAARTLPPIRINLGAMR